MALIENTLFGEIDREKIAIERITIHKRTDLKYTVGISGGKDSTVIYDLVKKSGIKVDYIHNFTTIDAPQTYKFIKKNYPDVRFIHPKIKPLPAMMLVWKEPPTQIWRMCCRYYKENYEGNKEEFLITGVRQKESVKRKNKRLIETCYRRKRKQYLNIIIDWSDEDVWEYIHKYNLPYNPLYDSGYRSIGEKGYTKIAKYMKGGERSGRDTYKEEVMERLRYLGYF